MAAWHLFLVGAPLAAEISGTVTGEDGTPLAGVGVYAYDLRLSQSGTTTDEDGRYTLRFLHEDKGYRIRVVPPEDMNRVQRYWPGTASFCEGERVWPGDTDADLQLPAGATVAGTLLDQEGLPVAGAVVRLEGVGGAALGLVRTGTSGADGDFAVVGVDVPEGDTDLYTCRVDVAGWPDQYLPGVYEEEAAEAVVVPVAGQVDLGTWPLLDGAGARGTIWGPDGPVAGASVHFYGSSQVVTVASGEDGTFEAWAVPPGEVLNWASAEGLATTYYPDADRPEAWVSVEEGERVEDMDLVLPAESTFTARLTGVTDAEGLTVLLYNDTGTVGRGALAEAGGTFTVDGLHGGTYALFVWAGEVGSVDDFVRDEDGEKRWFQLPPEGDHDAGDLVLPAGARLLGTVLGDDGSPVEGTYIYAENVETGETEVVTAEDDGTFLLGGLPEGRYTLRARYAHFCDADPGWVEVWWPDQVYEPLAASFLVAAGEERGELDFVLPADDDHDRMGDAWEARWGLDPTRDDAEEDPDGDGYTNLEEYLLGTNPVEAVASQPDCGCAAGGRLPPAPLLLALPLALRRRREPRVSPRSGAPRGRVPGAP